MKILIMGFTKIKYMPYINFYLENMDPHTNEVHILYWNRDLQDEAIENYSSYILHEFKCYQEDDVAKISKISSFIKYRKYVTTVIEEEQFDFIFVLHSLPGILIQDVLKKKYKDKYIFDYRDSTYEGFVPYKKMVGQLVENSVATFVSSDGFRCFLPSKCSDKIYTSHNLLTDSLSHRDEKKENGIPSDKIRIAFWGFIRHEALNKKIIERLSNDSRFELHYYGREQQIALNLKAYAKEIGAENIFFHGEYSPKERYEFVRSTDIIHNVYYDNNTLLAMGNKYYDGIIFKIPQLCMKGSFMARKATENQIGFACDPNESNFADKIYSFYSQLDQGAFELNCNKELQKVCQEYEAEKFVIRNSISKAV